MRARILAIALLIGAGSLALGIRELRQPAARVKVTDDRFRSLTRLTGKEISTLITGKSLHRFANQHEEYHRNGRYKKIWDIFLQDGTYSISDNLLCIKELSDLDCFGLFYDNNHNIFILNVPYAPTDVASRIELEPLKGEE